MTAKQAISVTLDSANLTWLKARAGASGARSVSDLLDRLIADARAKRSGIGPVTSVVGTIDINTSDPLLHGADAAVRTMFEASLGRPLLLKEDSPEYRATRRKSRRRRG